MACLVECVVDNSLALRSELLLGGGSPGGESLRAQAEPSVDSVGQFQVQTAAIL
jgi:hypothetical protein